MIAVISDIFFYFTISGVQTENCLIHTSVCLEHVAHIHIMGSLKICCPLLDFEVGPNKVIASNFALLLSQPKRKPYYHTISKYINN